MKKLTPLALALLLAGCVSVGVAPKDVEYSDEAVMLTVPIMLQDSRYDCGVSALSMLLAYYDQPADQEKAAVLREKAEQEEGLTGGDLEAYLKSEGLDVALFQGDLTQEVTGLYYHIDRGRPLVTALHVRDESNHFVLVTGYDPVNDWILLQDPKRGALVYSRVQFEHAWEGAHRFTLLATPSLSE